jgi:hypothetical protein
MAVVPMPAQIYFMELARRCRFLSDHTLDLRMARELRVLGDELEGKAREAQIAADAAAPAIVQAYAPRQCGGFEVPIVLAASLFRNFKSKTALES